MSRLLKDCPQQHSLPGVLPYDQIESVTLVDTIMGKPLKCSSLKRRDPQLIDLCLVVTYINPAIHAPGVSH